AARSLLLFRLITAVDLVGFAAGCCEAERQPGDAAQLLPLEPAADEAPHEVAHDRRHDEQRGNGEQQPAGLQSGGFSVLLRRLRYCRAPLVKLFTSSP